MREAAIIGIDSYDSKRYETLVSSRSNASRVAQFLTEELPAEQRFQTALFQDARARDVAEYLNDVLARLDEESIFILYFSGRALRRRRDGSYALLFKDALGTLSYGCDGAGALTTDELRAFSQRGKGKMFFCFDVLVESAGLGVCAGGDASAPVEDALLVAPTATDPNLDEVGDRWALASCADDATSRDGGAFVDALLAEMRDELAARRKITLGDDFVAGVAKRLRERTNRPTPQSSGTPFSFAASGKSEQQVDFFCEPADRVDHPQYSFAVFSDSSEDEPDAPPDQMPRDETTSKDRAAGARRIATISCVEVPFRWCPAGLFSMGSPESEEDRDDDENLHEVFLTNGFWLAETPTTQRLWTAVMGENPSFSTGDDLCPVENVNWKDCRNFIKKLNGRQIPGAGRFRLPTEAEWEYACRAGTKTVFPWGRALNGDKANCDGTRPYGTSNTGRYVKKTTPVGSYDANPWGLFDMSGNVWEWCADWYGKYAEGMTINPQGVQGGKQRVLRGGARGTPAKNCRAACRFCSEPNKRYVDVGCRLAMTEPN